uniref:Raftlin, lipid raft linker 1 n=1 Tax=Monodelphis domestica TaxID=13616 RepID=A0A5F8HEN1_MONDO
MGCRLNKLEKRDEKRPGNIYSTLKRPQVETKIDVAYEYRFLEFTTLTDVELPRSSAVRLSSLRDLPTQLQELYQQGFTLVALHPFVQPTDEREKTPQEQIFRAVLIKKTERSQKNDFHNDGYILELDCCSSLDHPTDQKIIPNFIKKIQDTASRGLEFVGVIPQYQCPGNSAGSSPLTPTANGSGESRDEKNTLGSSEDLLPLDRETPGSADICSTPAGSQGDAGLWENGGADGQRAEPLNLSTIQGNGGGSPEKEDESSARLTSTADTLAGNSFHSLTDGVFIFEDVSPEENKSVQGYDAIVVEQWTVLEGVEVQTDYIPLLNSLAAYGWQLTCVLPTPIVKTNREGNVATKQIVFLQRPSLPQKAKKRESKFQWRFSREDVHSRQLRKSKSKRGAREKQKVEENEKSVEEPLPNAGDAGNCVAASNPPDGVTSEEGAKGGPEEADGVLLGAGGGPGLEGEEHREGGAAEAAATEPPAPRDI